MRGAIDVHPVTTQAKALEPRPHRRAAGAAGSGGGEGAEPRGARGARPPARADHPRQRARSASIQAKGEDDGGAGRCARADRGTGPARGRQGRGGTGQDGQGPRLAELLHALRRRPLPLRRLLQSAAPRGSGRDREQSPPHPGAGRRAVRVQRRAGRDDPTRERQHQRPDLDQPDAHRQLHAVQRQPRLGLHDVRARQDVRHPAWHDHGECRQVPQPDVQASASSFSTTISRPRGSTRSSRCSTRPWATPRA